MTPAHPERIRRSCCSNKHRAIVVGGGPAGAWAAAGLARLGWRVTLFECLPRYRRKVCGHCLAARVRPLLEQEGLLGRIDALAAGRTSRLQIHLAENRSIRLPLTGRGACALPVGLITPRDRLDTVLLDHAASLGVEVHQPARVTAIDLSPRPRVAVQVQGRDYEFEADLLIGADGLRSRVARAAGLIAPYSAGRKFGFALTLADTHERTSEGPDPSSPSQVGSLRRPSISEHQCTPAPRASFADIAPDEINMFIVRGGYLGVVREHDHWHLAGLVNPRTRGLPKHPIMFLRAMAERFEPLRSLALAGVTRATAVNLLGTGPMPHQPAARATANVALVGDAAGYVEPFTGEGMSWAIESAETLIRTMADAPGRQWNVETAGRYEDRWQREIGRRQRFCRAIAWLIERPDLLGLLMRRPIGTSRLPHWLISRVVRG